MAEQDRLAQVRRWFDHHYDDLDEAAVANVRALFDRIAELERERDELRQELEGTNPYAADPREWGLRAMVEGLGEQVAHHAARAERAEAERDRLREALWKVAGSYHRAYHPLHLSYEDCPAPICKRERAALAGQEGDGD